MSEEYLANRHEQLNKINTQKNNSEWCKIKMSCVLLSGTQIIAILLSHYRTDSKILHMSKKKKQKL